MEIVRVDKCWWLKIPLEISSHKIMKIKAGNDKKYENPV